MALELAAEVWALFYSAPLAHRMHRESNGAAYRSLCGQVTATAAGLTEKENGKRCKRCARILENAK